MAGEPTAQLLEALSGYSPDPAVIRDLIARGANPNARNEDGYTALELTIEDKLAPEAMLALLEGGANPNAPGKRELPLMFVIYRGRMENVGDEPADREEQVRKIESMIDMLITHGAEPNLKVSSGFGEPYSALDVARENLRMSEADAEPGAPADYQLEMDKRILRALESFTRRAPLLKARKERKEARFRSHETPGGRRKTRGRRRARKTRRRHK